jgi:hypothetical protein
MKISRDSLSGQNTSRRAAGPGSSPGLSTKSKTKLWQKLRKLDALCAKYSTKTFSSVPFCMSLKSSRELEKYECLFAKYDKQRKQIRWNLKGIV